MKLMQEIPFEKISVEGVKRIRRDGREVTIDVDRRVVIVAEEVAGVRETEFERPCVYA